MNLISKLGLIQPRNNEISQLCLVSLHHHARKIENLESKNKKKCFGDSTRTLQIRCSEYIFYQNEVTWPNRYHVMWSVYDMIRNLSKGVVLSLNQHLSTRLLYLFDIITSGNTTYNSYNIEVMTFWTFSLTLMSFHTIDFFQKYPKMEK